MSPIEERWSAVGRWCVAAFIVGAASFVMLLGTLRTERLNVDVGPGDADYAQGLSDFWRYDGERTGAGDVLRSLSKKKMYGSPNSNPSPELGADKENHTSWERYYQVSDCSSSLRNDWYSGI